MVTDMREMKDSGITWIGEFPVTWSIFPFKYNFDFIAGATPDSTNVELWDGNINWITPADYKTKDIYILGGGRKISELGYKSCSTHMLPVGTIVVSKRAPIGTVAITQIPLCTNQGCLGLVKKNPAIWEKFYYYSLSIYDNVLNLFGSGTTFKEISSTVFQNIKIANPQPEEQKTIADFLDSKCSEIDSLAADIQEQIDTLEQYKRSVITEAVTKGLDKGNFFIRKGNSFSGDIESSFSVIRFKYIATIKSNLVSPEKYKDYYQIGPDSIEKDTGKILVHRTVEEAAVDSGNHLFKKGQILYSKIRPVLNKVTIAPYDGLCSADMYPIETNINTRFLLYSMLSSYFVAQTDLIARDRIKMPKINQDELGNILVYVPPENTQDKIVSFLDKKCAEIDDIISDKREQLTVLTDYKKSLIYEYVTGKKEVPN